MTAEERCRNIVVNESEVTSADDFCPNDLWIEIRDLSSTVDDPGTPLLTIRNAVEEELDYMSCNEARTDSTIYYRPAGSSNWVVKDDKEWIGDWKDEENPAYCSFLSTDEMLAIKRVDVVAGMNSARIKSTCRTANMNEDCATTVSLGSGCISE